MKHSIFLLLVVLALGLASCHRNKTEQSPNGQAKADTTVKVETPKAVPDQTTSISFSDASFLYVGTGSLYFYNNETHEAQRFTNEPDYVVDAICSTHGMLYYNAVANDRLLLKRINLNKSDPEPVTLTDWGLDLGNEDPQHDLYGDLCLSYDETQVRLDVDMLDYAWEGLNFLVYDRIEKTVKKYQRYNLVDGFTYDVPDESGFVPYEEFPSFDWGNFEDSDFFYYLDGEDFIGLNEQIDEEELVGYPDEFYGFSHSPKSLNPDGTKLLFAAVYGEPVGDWGEPFGYYAVSSLDGQEQQVICNFDQMIQAPQWIKDGSLVYIAVEGREAILFLMSPDGKIEKVGNSGKFCVLK